MIVSLLVTGYVFFLYLKLKSEAEVANVPEFEAGGDLKSAAMELTSRIEQLETQLVALRKTGGTTL
jgi:hypothetical protein